MEPKKTPREQAEALIKALRSLLIAYRRSIMKLVLWAILALIVLVVLLALISLSSTWLWGVVVHYVQPRTPSDRKELVSVFVVIGAGVVGLLTATAAVGNLYMSRRTYSSSATSKPSGRKTTRYKPITSRWGTC